MNTFENIMENGAFALLEQILHSPFSIKNLNACCFKGVQRHYYGVKGLYQ